MTSPLFSSGEPRRTSWQFTSGLINEPIMRTKEGKIVIGLYPRQNKMLPVPDTSRRYFLWEIDTKEQAFYDYVLSVYKDNLLPVFVHETVKGYHFISLVELEICEWDRLIALVRMTNARFPPNCVRILPNKWENEKNLWHNSNFYHSDNHKENVKLQVFASLMRQQAIGIMCREYFIVRYRIDKKQ